MKKLILLISTIALFSTACNKVKPTIESNPITSKNYRSLSTTYVGDPNCVYHYKGEIISYKSIPENIETGVQYVTDKEGRLDIFVFDNEIEFKEFVQLGGYISTYESSTILAKMELIEKARKYATNNGIIEYYEKTGIIKEDYLNYLNTLSKKTRGVGVLHNNTDGSGTWVPLTGTGQPTFGNFNDKASSASGIGLANTVFDRTFFRGANRWIVLGTGGLLPFNGAINFDNRTASAW